MAGIGGEKLSIRERLLDARSMRKHFEIRRKQNVLQGNTDSATICEKILTDCDVEISLLLGRIHEDA